MKSSKLSGIGTKTISKIKKKTSSKGLLIIGGTLLFHYQGLAQLDDLARAVTEARTSATTIGDDIIGIIKICAMISVAIVGVSFLAVREGGNADMTKRLGSITIALAVFYVLMEIVDRIV